MIWPLFLILFTTFTHAKIPRSYEELLDYVQEAPDQGETNTCLFVASTGAIELIANKLNNIKNPIVGGKFDLAESYVIHAPYGRGATSFFDEPVLRFNGSAVHISIWPYEAWNESQINYTVWNRHPDFYELPKINVPKVETIKLFQYGNKWSTYIIDNEEVQLIKESLWKFKSPILVNYNDDGFWHVVLIVGYDDDLPGECYDTDPKECQGSVGSFYVRDSFGVGVEVRNYNWFRAKGNAAFVVKPINPQ
jgi:hypothetical protein